MGKSLYIAEKPSVAQEFAKALKLNSSRHDGYLESQDSVVTWCYGHLVTMSYPEVYDTRLKRWDLSTLPFIPEQFKYEVIPSAEKQFKVVSKLLNRPDIDTIYVCTDSGREGEYIYRLVEQMSGVQGKKRRRVWIDSQTEEEILKGIKNAKDLSEYDNLSASAYLRAKEDYLMGINFSRLLTLRYGNQISNCMGTDRTVISVGRVMTCVLGMVVRREREIRDFVVTPFYRILTDISCEGNHIEAEWKVVKGSKYEGNPCLYKENGFKEKDMALRAVDELSEPKPVQAELVKIERKKEKKNPPLLFNLAELQNECSKRFKLSPDETLKVVQELYEKKLVTYPRTDARVLSTAVAKEITKNISGLRAIPGVRGFAEHILESKAYAGLSKTRYVNDSQITDHYAIIPTGQGIGALNGLAATKVKIYEVIVRRFLSIFYPAAVYQKTAMEFVIKQEHFFANLRVLEEPGYMIVTGEYNPGRQAKKTEATAENSGENGSGAQGDQNGSEKDSAEKEVNDRALLAAVSRLKKGAILPVEGFNVKDGETSPPKRYNSGSIILAMENAGQLIEDEELRAQIKGSGIGTSATRAEILKKLIQNGYLLLNQKTQVISPALLGEMIFDVVNMSIRHLLNPELTASWEKGLTYVANGEITEAEYMVKLRDFIVRRTANVMNLNNAGYVREFYRAAEPYYQSTGKTSGGAGKNSGASGKRAGASKRTGTSGKTTGKTSEERV
ncbi:MAG: type IA DNA topoisomerase [Lachnospiraceae bacterium]|nr:type IA DNA topoisomerase [Lachnospiraceae bacterium]